MPVFPDILGSDPFKSPLGLKTISKEDFLSPKERTSSIFSESITLKSDLFAFFKDLEIPIFSILFFDFLIPAVSKKTIGIPSKLYLSSIISLVVPDILEVIATFLFANLFIRVDLPELGLPTIDTINPDLRDSEN